MTAYFTASIVGKKEYLSNYLKILEILDRLDCDVISDHIINSSVKQVKMETKEERQDFHKKLDEWITDCDFVVAEVSFPSISVGYEISLALTKRKPVLVLYSEDNAPTLLKDYQSEFLACEKYHERNLEEIISEFTNYVHGANDSRFTFFISSRIASHLDKISKEKKIPKSVYIRQLIEKDIK